jgi:hypothetical protein
MRTLHHLTAALKVLSLTLFLAPNLHANPASLKTARSGSTKEFNSNTSRFALSQTEERRSFCSSLFHQAYDSCCKSESGCNETQQERHCNVEANTIHESCLSASQRTTNSFY